MPYNPINLILTTNKLTRPNYVDWKRNFDIILTWEELKWVTQEIAPSTPNGHFVGNLGLLHSHALDLIGYMNLS